MTAIVIDFGRHRIARALAQIRAVGLTVAVVADHEAWLVADVYDLTDLEFGAPATRVIVDPRNAHLLQLSDPEAAQCE